MLIAFITLTHADETIGAVDGDCMSIDCDATEKNYKPVCGGLDADSSIGFMNECALSIYNCQHQTGTILPFLFLKFVNKSYIFFNRLGCSN